MRRGGPVGSLAGSPTMVGAITTLIAIVTVFLAYNATAGLPFVPVYRVSAVLPDAQRLLPNNEVRIGGTRVGIIEAITPVTMKVDGQTTTGAKLDLKLDKTVDPLPDDTLVRVRYKSAFGLKYVELVRGTGDPLPEGGSLPIAQSSTQTEFDTIANTFDEKTRTAVRGGLTGFGDAFAGRGVALNEAIGNLSPLFANLQPVAELLTDPKTRLSNFFPALAKVATIVAPVADANAGQFGVAATTFGALASDPEALKDTISTTNPLFAEGTPALVAQQPFLADFADLSDRLGPAVNSLRLALPTLNDALETGTPVLLRLPSVNSNLERVFNELKRLVEQPQTKTTLLRLRETFGQAAPAAHWIAPFQTVCNYFDYWATYIPNGLSQENGGLGRVFRQTAIQGSPPETTQGTITGYSGIQANGRAGTLSPSPGRFEPHDVPIAHGPPYGPAVDSKGNADCQAGQYGYPLGKLQVTGQADNNPAIGVSNLPGNRGTTFSGRARVPKLLKPRKL